MIKLSKKSKIYIAAPAGVATGGPELLHQLAYELKKTGYDVSMYYQPLGHANPVHSNYVDYGINVTDQIVRHSDNVIIVPETLAELSKSLDDIQIVVWWLSVNFYFLSQKGFRGRLIRALFFKLRFPLFRLNKKDFKNTNLHLFQSFYAYSFLKANDIYDSMRLSDYLYPSFLSSSIELNEKSNIVAYNPKKGFQFTRKLIAACPEIKFVPIENMNRDEVGELLRRSKVYIDFGFHPGKDRIPREAAASKCCVITNKEGSAGNNIDLPIPLEFKFNAAKKDIENIRLKIQKCFDSFKEELAKQDAYREMICNEPDVFEADFKEIFGPK